mgnify:CR=1 FL=1
MNKKCNLTGYIYEYNNKNLTMIITAVTPLNIKPEHTCDFTGTWKTDATHHWHECSCGETDTKVAHSGGTATTTELAKCEVCGTSYGELKQPETKTIGEQIQDEYDSLKAGTTTTHTKWSFQATVVDMTATKYSDTHGNYNLRFVANVDGVLIGVFDGQVNNSFPTNIDGLEVGSVVTITGVIAENYTLTSGTYKVNIEFSKPEVSWTTNPSTSKYTVTYNANGHGTAPSPLINVTALPSPLPTLSATGYTFGGWYLDASCTQAATAGATINANTTLYAKWTSLDPTKNAPVIHIDSDYYYYTSTNNVNNLTSYFLVIDDEDGNIPVTSEMISGTIKTGKNTITINVSDTDSNTSSFSIIIEVGEYERFSNTESIKEIDENCMPTTGNSKALVIPVAIENYAATDDMLDTMYEANGVGLAAPQIGENLRIFVIDVSTDKEPLNPIVFVNPKIIKKGD